MIFLVCIGGERVGGMEGKEGEGWVVAQKILTNCLEQKNPPIVARRDLYHTTRPRGHL